MTPGHALQKYNGLTPYHIQGHFPWRVEKSKSKAIFLVASLMKRLQVRQSFAFSHSIQFNKLAFMNCTYSIQAIDITGTTGEM